MIWRNFCKLRDAMLARRCHILPISCLGKPRGGGRLRRSYLFWNWVQNKLSLGKCLKMPSTSMFFPRVVQEAKSREFMDLTQRGMSVIEYVSRFVQLSRFSPYLIMDEEKKAKKFERGLNPELGQ
ncbi:hypothetical protein SLA2020_492590 [Shorea laevis]